MTVTGARRTTAEEGPGRVERLLCVGLFVGFCALFTGIEVKTPLVIMKPFDLICLVTAPLIVLAAMLGGKLPRSIGFLLVTAFLAINAVLALKLGVKNGIREALQAVELVTFAAVLAMYRAELDWLRMARWFVAVAVVITAFNIYWHVSHGFIVGWKRLDEPKLLLSYAPPVIFALMLRNPKAGLGAYIVFAVIAVILIMSGERKAQIALMIELVILCAVGYTRLSTYLIGALAVAPLLYALILADPYLNRQFLSVFEISGDEVLTLPEMLDPASGVTQSNGQRLFALQVSKGLIQQYPFFGIGTNSYLTFVQNAYPYLPEYYILGIHNEFQRVLVENGAIGFAIYILPWLRVLVLAVWVARDLGIRTLGVYIMFLSVFFLQCFLEGSGNEAFLAFLMVALMPEFFFASGGRMAAPQAQGWLARRSVDERKAACSRLRAGAGRMSGSKAFQWTGRAI